jgi:hypothetical protein
VLEVNSNPAWSALQRVTRRPIAEALVADFLSRAAAPVEATPRDAPLEANAASSTGR